MSSWGTKVCVDCGQLIEAGVTGRGSLFCRDHDCQRVNNEQLGTGERVS